MKMAKQKSTPGPYGSQSSTLPIQSQEEEPNTDGGEVELSTERNSNKAKLNQDTTENNCKCEADPHEQHQCNRCCDIFFRVIGCIGNVLVIVAFAFLFYKKDFKKSDCVAIGGAATSLFANIGNLLADRKRRYDTRRYIKKKVLPVVAAREVFLEEINLMSLQPEDSASSCLTKLCECVCWKSRCSGCCCQEPCLSDDPLEPMCTTNPCRCLCCQCRCQSKCAKCPYLCSFLSFLPTFELYESTYNIVSSGWVLSSNVKAISGRIPTNASSKYFQDLTVMNQVLESIDVSLAIISLLVSLFIFISPCCKAKCCLVEQKTTSDSKIKAMNIYIYVHLSSDLYSSD